jgi:hypothetical protein
MRAYADLCRDEISALGTVRVSNNTIYIDDLFLFNQTVTPTSTEICQEDLSRFVYEYVKVGADPSLKLWWHSHVNMEVFWSATDANTINKYSKEWMVSIVSNKRDEFKVRLDIFTPIRICLDNLPYTVEYDKKYNTMIKQEIDAKVHLPFFNGRVVSEFFSGGEDYSDQRSFIPVPGDPKTVVMTEPRLPPRTPVSTIPKFNSKKSMFTKLWEFFFGEANFKTVEINKLEPVPPPKPTPAPVDAANNPVAVEIKK